MTEQETELEWSILIGLFRSTVEQTNMLTGQTKRESKLIFNRWIKEGERLLKHIEQLSNESHLEEITGKIEDSIHELRKSLPHESLILEQD